MEHYLQLPASARDYYLRAASLHSGVPRPGIEADWWQSFLIRSIFKLPFASRMTLKGSRPLSVY